MSQVSTELKEEHESWLDQIRNWEKEVGEMERHNGEISGRSESREFLKRVEHFQNQFIVQKNRLDQMKHNIKIYGGDLSKGQSEMDDYAGFFAGFRTEFDDFTQGQ